MGFNKYNTFVFINQLYMTTVNRLGVQYAPSIIRGVFIQCDSLAGMSALKDFNEVYKVHRPSGKILSDIEEAKQKGENLYYQVA